MPAIKQNLSSSAAKGDLFKYQSQLPKLPVPTLDETAGRYLKSVQPFLSKEQYSETAAKVKAFVGGEGVQLQSRLQEYAQDKDNWLATWWDDYAYMSYRDPVVPFVSYFFSHKDVNNAIGKDQLFKATLLAHYTIEFMAEVQTENLDPEIIKGNPYCMNAFRYMFNNSRVPKEGTDITKLYDGEQHQYFVVIYNNNFYKVNHHKDGKPISIPEIYQQLQAIKNSNADKGEGIGALTSLNRDEFVSAYNNLVATPINEQSFETIFASSFVICLDSNKPITIEEKSANSWHGDGQNRYFDKPLEYFVSENGNSGFLGEHSKMDATPTVQLNNYVLSKIASHDPKKFLQQLSSSNFDFSAPKPQILEFDLNPVARKNIATAIAKFDETISTHDEELFQHYAYGKGLIKKFKVSPDAYVQMLIQLAYFKLTGKIRPTYESAATRKFLNGRTEAGRTVSPESKQFVETWTNYDATIEEKVATFQNACKQHVKYLSEAADGRGVDRHLFGLKQMLRTGEPVPEIFKDPIFSYSQSWYISSSQVPSEYFQSWGWSQVIDQGFGLAYLINNDWLHIHIASKKGNGLSSGHLKAYLIESANEMKEILSKGLLEPQAKL
ncbi:carnitine O-acetyltransferase mitochondrial precursor [Suhomyces tanzawaensis NRRL Y-17324]|uniref:Carnitine O-acetyltransferase, mitochondrial n=1 Tax=Suhomyces tanzawaensis NRRL Y-17324 TaxID=984487 RepID=A0A1E4SQC2_9ASCO|nr:carnitine O-acetyltransferase mitochondrial precursor [Suhomyces tanzawaensis NRRL Y-17324]ODV81695.1 carnitine O-acetyltransferase mitochondrial precursor [Suhomyces tanzawaensis NRRL Y-17324]